MGLLALGLRGSGAVAALGYIWILDQWLASDVLGRLLILMALIGLIAGLSNAGWLQVLIRDGTGYPARCQRFLHTAQRWGRGLALITTMPMMFFLSPSVHGLLVLCCILLTDLTLIAAACRAQGDFWRPMLALGVLRWGLAASLVIGMSFLQDINLFWVLFTQAVGLFMTRAWLDASARNAGVGALGFGLSLPPQRSHGSLLPKGTLALWFGQVGQTLFQNLDILVLSFIVAPEAAMGYLVFRRIATSLGLLFDALRAVFEPKIALALRCGSLGPAKAQINIYFALFGAVGALALCVFMPVLAQIFNLKQPVSIGFTLVLANAAPAVFGAGGMLLSMSGQERLRSKLVWLLLPLVFVSYLIAATMGVMVLAYAVALHSMGLWGLYRWFLR